MSDSWPFFAIIGFVASIAMVVQFFVVCADIRAIRNMLRDHRHEQLQARHAQLLAQQRAAAAGPPPPPRG